MSVKWKGVLIFDDQSESFALGFEAGKLYGELSSGKNKPCKRLAHVKNKNILMQIATGYGKFPVSTPIDDDYIFIEV